MHLSHATNVSSALSDFNSQLNKNASTWRIIFPAGFDLSPCFLIPTINITPSHFNNSKSAWNQMCSQIINGLKLATPTGVGDHLSYTGTALFNKIL